MLDFDGDGLISHSDIFKLLMRSDKNDLIKKTTSRILGYVKNKANNNELVNDRCLDDYLKKDNLTLKKFKFMMYMKEKKKN